MRKFDKTPVMVRCRRSASLKRPSKTYTICQDVEYKAVRMSNSHLVVKVDGAYIMVNDEFFYFGKYPSLYRNTSIESGRRIVRLRKRGDNNG